MKKYLFVDQYGSKYKTNTVKELRSKIGGGGSRVHKMYTDNKVHCGYVINDHWLMMYIAVQFANK